MADAIFISYRRDDSEGEAGRLFDDLTRAFGNDAVFMDVAGIKPGLDFRKAIEDNVASCGVLLAIVGPQWASIANADGTRRLQDPNDFVALEIASALKREVPVIPVLVHDAKMPAVSLLPESLKSFCYRNSVELSHARWNSDVHLLIEALRPYVNPGLAASTEPLHANVPVQLPAPHPTAVAMAPAIARNWLPMALGALGGIVLIALVFAYFLFKRGPDTAKEITTANPAVNSATQSAQPVASSASVRTGAIPAMKTAPAPIVKAAGSEFAGDWKRSGNTGDADSLGRLVISAAGGAIRVRAFGKCQTSACDWGELPGILNGQVLTATFSPPASGTDTSRTAQVRILPVSGGLDVTIQNTFQSPDGQRRSSAHPIFVAAQ